VPLQAPQLVFLPHFDDATGEFELFMNVIIYYGYTCQSLVRVKLDCTLITYVQLREYQVYASGLHI